MGTSSGLAEWIPRVTKGPYMRKAEEEKGK